MESLPAPTPSHRIGPLEVYETLLASPLPAATAVRVINDVRRLRKFLGLDAGEAAEAVARLLSGGRELALAFRDWEASQGNRPATVNNRMCSIRRLVDLAREHGLIDWRLHTPPVRFGADRAPIIPVPAPAPSADCELPARIGPLDVYETLLASARSKNTRAAWRWDVVVIGRFLGIHDPALVAAAFIAGGRGQAIALALRYRQYELERGQSAAACNRRLATMRKITVIARSLDLIDWVIDSSDIPALPSTPYRDTRGPGEDGWAAMWKVALNAGDTGIARRNRALLRLMHDLALRASEVLGIDVEDLDLDGLRVAVKGKGKAAKEWMSINATVERYLREWLATRGTDPGPLFTSYAGFRSSALRHQIAMMRDRGMTWDTVAATLNDEGMPGSLTAWTGKRLRRWYSLQGYAAVPSRLGYRDLLRYIVGLGERAGLDRHATPHQLRHLSITTALDRTGGDVRKVQRYARHASPQTTIRYDDNRQDLAGEITRMMGDD
jgi:integrase/recombinase XerC